MKLPQKDQDLKQKIKELERIKDIWDTEGYRKAVKRSQKMSTHDLIGWIDGTGSGMVKALMDYRSLGMPESLEELRIAVSYLQAMVEELLIREENK